MSKRRQTTGLQILGALAILIFVAYFFVPIDSDTGHQTTLTGSNKQPRRVKAAFVILARNSDLNGVRWSMRQVEDRFNRKFNYPYVFLNDQEFTKEFITLTRSLTRAPTYYGKIDASMWGYPAHINQTKAAECREDMAARRVIYGGSESYRHMCRFQSGFFFRHPLLADYEYYWRVEPDVQFFCDIDYDVFQMMKDNNFKYGSFSWCRQRSRESVLIHLVQDGHCL